MSIEVRLRTGETGIIGQSGGRQMAVYANKKTKKIHASKRGDQCRQGEIQPKNLARYKTVQAALAAGLTTCKACYPA